MTIRKELLGTEQHRSAGDLSQWLVHLTRSKDDLVSIIREGEIQAPNPFGAGRNYETVKEAHRSVCFTEIPLNEIQRMTHSFSRKRPWGLAFNKERLRKKYNAQPVWYVSDPSPQWNGIEKAMECGKCDIDDPIWTLTPYIERVGDLNSGSPNDWRWEREWRVQGNFTFEWDDVHLLIADEEGAPAFLDKLSLGAPFISPNKREPEWYGWLPGSWEENVTRMLDRFFSQFVSADECGGRHWDREEKVYLEFVYIFDTEDAINEAFGDLPPELRQKLEEVIISQDDAWCRLYDVAEMHR